MISGTANPFPSFRPRPPWYGGDLQTLRNTLSRVCVDLSAWPGKRTFFDMNDGDRLAGCLHEAVPMQAGFPLVVLIHGLTGCEDSPHIRATARHLLQLGYPVLRVNLRGSTPSRPTSGGLYHAGKSGDLNAIFGQLDAPSGVVAVGYSLGGNVLLKYLGESGRSTKLLAAVAVSAPIDLAAASGQIHRWRNRLYHHHLLRRMKTEALAAGAQLDARERSAIGGAKSIYEFDDRFVAPRNGFRDAGDYYRRSSAKRFLGSIAVPTLVIHARDDPWVPTGAYLGTDWTALQSVSLLQTKRGGHVGFHGIGDKVPWHDRCTAIFLSQVAAESRRSLDPAHAGPD